MYYEIRRPRGIRTIAKFNEFRILNDSNVMSKEQINELAETYRPETQQPELSVKTFLRNDQVKVISNNELMQRYIELGYTAEGLAKKKDRVYALSIEYKQLGIALKTIESIEDTMGLNTKVKIKETRQINTNLQDNFSKAVKESRTVTIEKTETATQPPAEQENGDNSKT